VVVRKVAVVVVRKVAVVVVRKVAVVVVHKVAVAVPVVRHRAQRRLVRAAATDNHFEGRTKKSALFYERIA